MVKNRNYLFFGNSCPFIQSALGRRPRPSNLALAGPILEKRAAPRPRPSRPAAIINLTTKPLSQDPLCHFQSLAGLPALGRA